MSAWHLESASRSDPPAESTQTAQHTSSPAVQPVDEVVLTELRNDIDDEDGSILDQLIDDYLADSAVTVHELGVAVTIGDVSKILRLAHSWKSTSAILGATKLAALLSQAEHEASRAPDKLAALTTEIEQEYGRVSAFLSRLQHLGRDERDARVTA